MGRFFGWLAASTLRISLTVVVAVALIAGAVVGVALSQSRSDSAADRSARASALDGVTDSCKDAVAKQLKSPGSAQWSSIVTSQPGGNFLWSVEGVVDSQNGFGALMRGDFLCAVEVDSKGGILSTDADLTMRE